MCRICEQSKFVTEYKKIIPEIGWQWKKKIKKIQIMELHKIE